MVTLVPVEEDQISELAAMADGIWHEYFPSILSDGQIDYMVDRFQSERAMRNQISAQGYRYYFIVDTGMRIGYTAIKPEDDRLFISKIYLIKEYRGKGLGSKAIELIDTFCRSNGLSSAYLTVNRNNQKAIRSYSRNGFVIVRDQVADIGNGYVMDDYVMEKVYRCSFPRPLRR